MTALEQVGSMPLILTGPNGNPGVHARPGSPGRGESNERGRLRNRAFVVTAVLQALVRLLLALLAGWNQWYCRDHPPAQRAACNHLARCPLPGRAAKGADSQCIPIRHPSFRKPDPLIYTSTSFM